MLILSEKLQVAIAIWITSNFACSANVATILGNDDMKDFEATCYDVNREVIYPREKVDAEIMSKFNSDEKVHTIAIEGSIPAIPSDKIRLCLRDTSGPNSFRDNHHKELVESIIKGNTNSIVVYVMNATQMEIYDEKVLFDSISREMKKEGKQSHDRFIFVINKCDALDEGKGETVPKLLDRAREYLNQFDITDPILIPTNALLALTIRRNLAGETLARREQRLLAEVDDYVEYEDLHYEDFAVLTSSVRDSLKRKVAEYHANEDDWACEALIHTGIPALEETILDYIEKYSVKITNQGRLPITYQTTTQIINQSKETSNVTNFSIKYNPYLVQCEFKKNGNKMTAKNSKFSEMSNKRLQFILGEHKAQGWRGLPQEIAATCNDNVINLDFQGRRIDYDDLMYAIKKYQEDCKVNNQRPADFNVTFSESKNDNDIITELDKIIAEIKKKNLPQFTKKNRKGKTIFDAYEEAKDGMLSVSVIATMSSGKSTLINSLLHTELLPSSNAACTATVATILDNDDMKNYEATCYDADDKVLYPRKEVNAEIMAKYNSDEKVHTIAIEGSIPAIPSDKIRLCLFDTPDPNNSRNEHHKELTESIIKGKTNSIVIYVMNATQMEIKDDKYLLESISRDMKKEGKQSHDRFIFVINKCDALDEEKGEPVPKILDRARDYLKQFDITDPILIPTNSLLALIIKKKLNGQTLTRSENRKYNDVDDYVEYEDLHYEDFAVLTPSVYDTLKRKVAEYHANEDDWDYEALVHTGVPALEETIKEYVEKYAYPIKINDAVKDIITILQEINMKAEFEKQIATDNQQLSKVQMQIEETHQKRSKSQATSEKFKRKN